MAVNQDWHYWFRWVISLPWNQALGGYNFSPNHSTPTDTYVGQQRPYKFELTTVGGVWFVNNSTTPINHNQPPRPLTCFINDVEVPSFFGRREHLVDGKAGYGEELYVKMMMTSAIWDQILGPYPTHSLSSSPHPTPNSTATSINIPPNDQPNQQQQTQLESIVVQSGSKFRFSNFDFRCDSSLPLYIPNIEGEYADPFNNPGRHTDYARGIGIEAFVHTESSIAGSDGNDDGNDDNGPAFSWFSRLELRSKESLDYSNIYPEPIATSNYQHHMFPPTTTTTNNNNNTPSTRSSTPPHNTIIPANHSHPYPIHYPTHNHYHPPYQNPNRNNTNNSTFNYRPNNTPSRLSTIHRPRLVIPQR